MVKCCSVSSFSYMVIEIGTGEDIIKEKDIIGKREGDIEIVVKEIDGDRDRRAQSATNLLLPVQPLPRDLILSQSNICLTAAPTLCPTLNFYILCDFPQRLVFEK